MPPPFFRRRSVWVPTLWGWVGLCVLPIGMMMLWWFKGEAFLSITDRQPAEVLVVEGWIGPTGVAAAGEEFLRGGYLYVVGTSSLSGENWDPRRWSFAVEAVKLLRRSGIPDDQVILAKPPDLPSQRTFESAVKVRTELRVRGINPTGITVFTRGAHARRSRLTYARVMGPNIHVGVIAWHPPRESTTPWWRSSVRAEEFLKETTAWLYELLLHSGRFTHPTVPVQP